MHTSTYVCTTIHLASSIHTIYTKSEPHKDNNGKPQHFLPFYLLCIFFKLENKIRENGTFRE